ncbi:transmembrane channel-like protein 6 isoform X2 [Betta splendens]|uniref:Transmembrane channel-like protein n=1 Tax=Betta splendens TaxID=158456 RepID=A0A6P7NDP6_BETSP|nr:transmembrane channel-like protein 6 isoform X2 [Betta splendens]
MARSVTVSDHICEVDSDYENMGDEPGQRCMVQFESESTASGQTSPESLEMEVLESADNAPIQRHRWSAATLRVMSSMPSSTAGRSSAAAVALRSRRSSLHRRTDPVSSRDPSRPLRRLREDAGEAGGEGDALASGLRGLSVGDGMRRLRAMPLSLADKMELRRLAFSDVTGSSLMSRSRCRGRQTWCHPPSGCSSLLGSLQLWQVPLKRLSGRFGTGVLSYFLFLRTLLRMNLFLFIVLGLFVAAPQLLNPPPHGPKNDPFTGLELLTGAGYITHSVIFYGYYTNTNTNASDRCQAHDPLGCLKYNIPAAYFLTIAITFFVICVRLVYSVSKALGKSLHVKSNRNLAVKVFCSWDFKVCKKSSIRLQSEKISTQLKELLSDMILGKEEKSCAQKCGSVLVHLLTWAVCVACIAGSAWGIHSLSEARIKNPPKDTELLYFPVVVSGVNLLLPGVFNLSAWAESSHSPSVRVYVSVFRNLLLKVSIFGVLWYRWLKGIAWESGLECWENAVGQELYSLLVMDFIFTVLYTLMGEFLWRLFTKHMLIRKRKPVFDIARNVLELIYGQTLTWLGVLFAPLLPAVQLLKLFLLFYIKKNSVMLNCQASTKPWRATQMSTLFLTLLCFPSFFGAAVSVAYTLWTIQPSRVCGPFRNRTKMFESVKESENSHTVLSWLDKVYSFLVDYPLLPFLTSGVFLFVIYFHSQVVDGQRKIISQLEKQIENEGNDKLFLITKLQEMHEREGLAPSHR